MNTMTDEQVKQALNLSITPEARDYVREMLAQEPHNNSILGIRFGLEPAGCSGFSYVFNFAKDLNPEDKKIQIEGITFIVNTNAIPYLKDTVIDCKKEAFSTTIQFKNPQVKGQCGCGESVNFEIKS